MSFYLPTNAERIAIIGRTGSGKTQAAVWHLSQRNFDEVPWIAFNFKGDDLIDAIRGTVELGLTAQAPRRPGIYIVRPQPHQTEELDEFLWRIWAAGNIGLYFDEGYMIGNSKAFQAILTQGRSKRLPCIVLTQRPVWISRFVWSESDFFQVFSLTNADDQAKVREFVPFPRDGYLKPFHSIYHDVKRVQTVILRPVPNRASLLQSFRQRMPQRLKAI